MTRKTSRRRFLAAAAATTGAALAARSIPRIFLRTVVSCWVGRIGTVPYAATRGWQVAVTHSG